MSESRTWSRVPLSEVADRVAEKNHKGYSRVMTVSAEHGLIDQERFFNKRVASEDLSGYWVVHPGDFVYNKSTSKGAPFGAVVRHDGNEPVVVTSLYFVFRPRLDVVNSDFLLHACNSSAFFDSLRGSLREGARAHGLLNVRLGDFYSALVTRPPDPEQRRIVALIAALDSVVETLSAETNAADRVLEALRAQMASDVPTEPLETYLQFARSGGTPSRNNPNNYGGDIPWLKSGEVASDWISTTSESITGAGLSGSSAWLVPAESVVVAMYGATASQVGYLASPMSTNQAVLALGVDPERADARFLYHWMCSQSRRLKGLATGAAQPNLSKGVILARTGFPVMTLADQKGWADALDSVTSTCARLSAERDRLSAAREALVASLLTQTVASDPLPVEEVA